MPDQPIGITEQDFNSAIPLSLQPYIHVATIALPSPFTTLYDAFRIAMGCIHTRLRITRPLEIVISKAPFKLRLGNGDLIYTPNRDEIINVHIDDRLIFIDAEKMSRHPKEMQVACILEEVAHAVMNISDETLVSHVVALLYPEVLIIDGKYHSRASEQKDKMV